MKVKLNYINQSEGKNNPHIVIFQKPTNPDWNTEIIAWKVIKNCGYGNYHPFEYDFDLQVNASDSYGNFTPQLKASPGDTFEMIKEDGGTVLKLSSDVRSTSKQIVIENNLAMGSINAFCYRSNSLCAKKSSFAPGEKCLFELKSTLYIGVVAHIEEGKGIGAAVLNDINTEFSLLGLKSADIVMHGGGEGAEAQPYTFTLENAVYM